MTSWKLTSDGAFTVAGSGAAFEGWLPRSATRAPRGSIHLDLRSSPLGIAAPATTPTLSLLDVATWVEGDGAMLRHPSGDLDGELSLAERTGILGASPGTEIEPLCTIASALVLGRSGRALVHSAGVLAPDGSAWLILGDTHSGKSTTTATLAHGGWRWLADDQVILAPAGGGGTVEGLPRVFNLDAGYGSGAITGKRIAAGEGAGIGAPTLGAHPLGGILLTQVAPDSPTRLAPATPAEGFVALVRQSPWLLADPGAAEGIQRLLVSAAARPSAHLVLGRDSYRRPEVLIQLLLSLIEGR